MATTRLPGLLRSQGCVLRQMVVGSRHIHQCKTLNDSQLDNNYNNDFDSFKLSPASTSHRIYSYKETQSMGQPSLVFNEQRVREDLSKLTGGNVDLIQDEETGIATVTLCNPTKANAITGRYFIIRGRRGLTKYTIFPEYGHKLCQKWDLLYEKDRNIHLNDQFPLKIAKIFMQKQNFPGMSVPNSTLCFPCMFMEVVIAFN